MELIFCEECGVVLNKFCVEKSPRPDDDTIIDYICPVCGNAIPPKDWE